MKFNTYWLAFVLAICWPVTHAMAADSAQVSDEIEITVNINTAPAEELATLLKGIGLKKAQAIVEYREANGAFQSKQELTQVKGIGPSIVAKNDDRILL